ncbi:MAG: TIGR00730 family Rossman fold protein [Alphaproteobacteria bacterium]
MPRITDYGRKDDNPQAVMSISRVCVYCGSAGAVGERYRDAARELGSALAQAGIDVVFGGGRIGLMGLVADAALDAGGRVVGIIPGALRDAELAHPGLTELVITGSMHERKRVMAERSDAFAVLPGGIGTLDEMFEIVTWRQLGLHDKPVFLVDIDGYWQPLRALLDHLVAHRFAAPLVPRLLEVVPGVPELLGALQQVRSGGGFRADLP